MAAILSEESAEDDNGMVEGKEGGFPEDVSWYVLTRFSRFRLAEMRTAG